MATFNLWQWVLVAIVVFAIVLPACLATALIWFGPRHDAPRRRAPDACPTPAPPARRCRC
ncbi:hypothetical protein XPU_4609 [Xanthomonas arboricola pv. pruni str. MAFF 311562]|nr:hypothetical protein XPU_4609 [Xanthomonas arboricola pv. pruni str. MAFF 311562]GAE62188.1 hypothetical protein XPN_4094 [Xanthomonas arboricola pv. pruni MAFF 301427]